MFIWRKRATAGWLSANETALREIAGSRLAITARSDRKRAVAEIAHNRRRELEEIHHQFGGAIEKLPSDWLKRFLNRPNPRPLRIGQHLKILPSKEKQGQRPKRGEAILVIPAGAAFGTGEHATTAMCLVLLERVTRDWNRGWSMLDLGTGTGILALAGRRCGAGKVIAVDSDPTSISTAVHNARLNRVRRIRFSLGDARKFDSASSFDLITANLFTGLLTKLLPSISRLLKPDGRVILSGILRAQELEITMFLKCSRLTPVLVRRRGKWVSLVLGRQKKSSQNGSIVKAAHPPQSI